MNNPYAVNMAQDKVVNMDLETAGDIIDALDTAMATLGISTAGNAVKALHRHRANITDVLVADLDEPDWPQYELDYAAAYRGCKAAEKLADSVATNPDVKYFQGHYGVEGEKTRISVVLVGGEIGKRRWWPKSFVDAMTKELEKIDFRPAFNKVHYTVQIFTTRYFKELMPSRIEQVNTWMQGRPVTMMRWADIHG